ncbi:putative nucleic-acid-binding protein [Roseiarcus fermentans]|uniref:Putative nucleic-acid-binding protein n=1 Tax=Roseiarcus fermentans TaxID=1473586 RepID=A0A366EK30_9HYPH|nr:type II toxin-antitoxin system VapC family toxin [Roseiarcus fermentans]RBP02306.1 putative nucleic-acid-binding protein [Roseiarcus fermentans]
MLAIDTNIVIRFLTRDDETLAQRALKIVSDTDVFAPVTVILEAEWVLRDAYDLPRDEVIRQLRRFCGLERVTVGAADAVGRALDDAERGLGFADALHLAMSEDCEAFATFDRRLAKKAATTERVPVRLALASTGAAAGLRGGENG